MAQETDKQKQQAKLLAEIMHGDEKDGLYEPTVSKMERVQTAVQWLDYNLDNLIPFINQDLASEYIKLFEQAKQMEKEQIMDAIINNQNGLLRRKTIIEAEQYYNETYNNQA